MCICVCIYKWYRQKRMDHKKNQHTDEHKSHLWGKLAHGILEFILGGEWLLDIILSFIKSEK